MSKARTRIPLDPEWETERKRQQILGSAVAELDLDLRTVNGLEEVGVLYVKELLELTRADLIKVPNFGNKSIDQIIRVLGAHGLAIREQAAPSRSK